MKRDNYGSAFAKTGRVEDYLRYCGVDIYENGVGAVSPPRPREEQPPYASDNRRPDHPGKQQYR